ncbi:MAG: proline dehydrogenase family protein [Ignavibacteria bacterium]|nr:proline dehydrogenase family protein [Ignavibacteria bacterium]
MRIVNKIMIPAIQVLPRSVVKLFAGRYIAGDKLSDAVSTVKSLNARNMMATMDVLGEAIRDRNEAVNCKDENLAALEAMSASGLDCNLSVKLTMLGLNIDFDFCLGIAEEIAAKARSLNRFVRIDMEDSSVTEQTIRIFEECRKKFDNVGIVLQAYLKRSHDDILRLTEEKANFRICKGIYVEPESIAYKDDQEIRENFIKLLRTAFERGAYCGIATHDDWIVNESRKLVKDLRLEKDKYEFQMLLGVRESLRDKLVKEGYRTRIYVPFGLRWYEYSIRRFKENPNLAGQVVKSILTGN